MSASLPRLLAPLALTPALLLSPAAARAEHLSEEPTDTIISADILISNLGDNGSDWGHVYCPGFNREHDLNFKVESIQLESAKPLFTKGGASRNYNNFLPYYLASLNHGIATQALNVLARASVWRDMNPFSRWGFSCGADIIGGYATPISYLQWTGSEMRSVERYPSLLWVQQLYATVRHRRVFLTAGQQEHSGHLVNPRLSSGDLIESGNARPIPELRAGFVDYQNIPFTKGWIQIEGVLAYGKMTDNGWLRKHYNFYSSHITTGQFYTYKRCFFRTNPYKPFSVTLGMQTAGVFGGVSKWYNRGELVKTVPHKSGIKEFAKMFFPTDGGLDFYSGSSIGAWEAQFRYRIPGSGDVVKAYFQKPFEDGSGIGFLNGWDGLWGIEYNTYAFNGYVQNIVVEYLDFTNQSGPMHWDPDDNPGTPITKRAEGADDYYNNSEYNAYANYGMAIGSPFLVSPIYNTDGYPQFLYNRMRGCHVGVEGNFIDEDTGTYRVLAGYRRSWGSGYIPLTKPRSNFSIMGEIGMIDDITIPGLSIKAQVAADFGSLLGVNYGCGITVSYSGAFDF